jgi:hypothetical protein
VGKQIGSTAGRASPFQSSASGPACLASFGVSARHMTYPNVRKGIWWSCIVGSVVGLSWFGLCCWLSTIPPATEVSLSLALRPWWSNWSSALFLALLTGLPVGILVAFRPDFRDTNQKGTK